MKLFFVLTLALHIGCCPFSGGVSVVIDLLFIVAPIVCGGSVFGPCVVI